MKTPDKSQCHVCHSIEKLQSDNVVYQDADWTVTSVQDVPGLLMMFTNSHDDGLASLSASAASSFGGLAQKISASLVAKCGFDRVALIQLGDNTRHTHLLLMGRPAGDQPVANMDAFQSRLPSLKDPEKNLETVNTLRQALQS